MAMDTEEYEELWDDRAQVFDVDYGGYNDDFGFFESYVDETTTVLELGSGTGRLPLHLSEFAQQADGLDLSSEMVAKANKNADGYDNVSFYQSSMSDFDIDRKYDLIINQGNSFLMMNDEQKHRTLECVREHLTPDGRLVVQIANPNRWQQNPQGPIIHLHETSTESERIVINYSQDIDEDEQVNHMIWFRERIDRETNEVTKRVWPIDFQYLTHEGALGLIRDAGFDVSTVYGDFDKSAYSDSSNRMIFECIKA